MYILVYAAANSTQPLQSQSFTLTAGTNAPLTDATFTLSAAPAAGTTYYFLAFRDTNGDGVYNAGEPVTNGGTPFGDAVMQGTNTPDDWTLM
jgi:hypothetical protein